MSQGVLLSMVFMPGFCSMKQVDVFLFSTVWDTSPSQGYLQHLIHRYPFIHPDKEKHRESQVSGPKTKTNDPARDRNQTARFEFSAVTKPTRLPLITQEKVKILLVRIRQPAVKHNLRQQPAGKCTHIYVYMGLRGVQLEQLFVRVVEKRQITYRRLPQSWKTVSPKTW